MAKQITGLQGIFLQVHPDQLLHARCWLSPTSCVWFREYTPPLTVLHQKVWETAAIPMLLSSQLLRQARLRAILFQKIPKAALAAQRDRMANDKKKSLDRQSKLPPSDN
jgi:hypothetical protein